MLAPLLVLVFHFLQLFKVFMLPYFAGFPLKETSWQSFSFPEVVYFLVIR